MLIPIRHHSPACARLVRALIEKRRPAAVLIEGPADFNDRLDELLLDHQLPIAIYSYVAWQDAPRQGAYYPFTDFSPEWQALQAARAVGAITRFIDLPFALTARHERQTHLWADGRLRASDYVEALCRNLGVDSFDDAWDFIAEQDPQLAQSELGARVEVFCRSLRELDGSAVAERDLKRERFMAAMIRAAQREFGADRVLVIIGGYHQAGLEDLLSRIGDQTEPTIEWPGDLVERGLAITPYSDERLDNLRGYDAGMPSPGFYQRVFEVDGQSSQVSSASALHRPLLAAVARRLRELKQSVSTADLIAVETSAQALAALRGHARVFRRDLIDAIVGALVKDEVHLRHPFLVALESILRGNRHGRLAASSPLPPLVKDIRRRLEIHGLLPAEDRSFERSLPLLEPSALEPSQLLHGLRVLEIPGFDQVSGVDFATRDDLSRLEESWTISWSIEQEAALIEATRYGSVFEEAIAARLLEKAQDERSAGALALFLLEAVQAGASAAATAFRARFIAAIDQDGDLGSVAVALAHLLYLFVWDDVFAERGNAETGRLLAQALDRALWLLEAGADLDDVAAIRTLRDAFQQGEKTLGLDRALWIAVLGRVQQDPQRSPALRGACAGALWSQNAADPTAIRRDLHGLASAEQLGDYLFGLFSLAREEAQRDPELLAALRAAVAAWDDNDFLGALPGLRLAFTTFTAREKDFLAARLIGADADLGDQPVALAVSFADAAAAFAFETHLFEVARRYGVELRP